MIAKRICQFAIAVFFALCCATTATAQTSVGFPNLIPEDCHEFDCVNLLSNTVTLSVPIRSKAGAIPVSATGTAGYYMNSVPGSTVNGFVPSVAGPAYKSVSGGPFGGPFQVGVNNILSGFGAGAFPTITTTPMPCTGTGTTTKYTQWAVYNANGTIHYLPSSVYTDINSSGVSCITGSGFTNVQTTDGSGFTASAAANAGPSGVVAYSRSGLVINPSAMSMTDANGNKLVVAPSGGTAGTLTDSMNLTAATGLLGTGPYQWTDVNGHTQEVSLTIPSSTTLQTNFGCPGQNQGQPADFGPSTANWDLPSAITLADGTTIGLTYEPTPGHTANTTGRIQEITLPQGGTISYAYQGGNNGIDCNNIAPPTLTRTLGNGDVTSYSLNWSSGYVTNNVTDPGGNVTVYYIAEGVSGTNSVVMEVLRYQGSSTLLSTEIYNYNTAFTTSPTYSSTAPGVVTKLIVYRRPKGMSNWSAVETHFDAYGNVTYKAEYDYGASSPTRATTITYGSCTASCATASPTISNTAMAANHIFDRPGEVVTAQNGVNVAQANYTYNSTGQMTSKQVWTGSTFIGQTSSNTYNTNGTPSAVFDLANKETDFTYASGGYSDNCTGITQYPFPTKVKNVGTGLYTQATYDCQGGVKLTDVDANGNTTTYAYTNGSAGDPYWRVTGITDPYSVVVYETYPTSGSSTKSGSSFTFNSSNSIQGGIATTDAYDRVIDAQMYQSPSGSNYDTVSTSYGWSGNYSQVQTSEPCSTTSGAACSSYAHTSKFDPLGRLYTESTTSNETVTNTYSQNDVLSALTPAPIEETSSGKQTQTEYDGLGRVTKVCHIGSTASTGSGTACGQNTGSASGATDAYTYTQTSSSPYETEVYVKRSGSQQRTTYFDGLGRLVSTTTPEGGTWNYYYDTAACTGATASSGNLTCAKDPNGNVLLYFYDALNRVTKVNANGTTCRHFYYDATYGTVPSGVTTPTNTLGRMAEASTDNCSGTLITDEWFSYDKDGRTLNYWQSSPHSTEYYESAATFYANGALNALTITTPSEYTGTYGLDGEGRVNTFKAGSTNLVTGATYYPESSTLCTGCSAVSLTGTTPDNDQYLIDPNTGNITQYEFTVGNTPVTETGALTWNPNGTLAKIAVTDNFYTGNSYTCLSNSAGSVGYGYDDWARLNEFDCGSGNWGQQFSYDIYDNLSKSVLSGRTGTTWAPIYSSSTNQFSGGTYDANGNVTADGNFVYGWNEFSKMKWAAASGTPTCGTSGRCITYDAFGRAVETSVNSTWTEHWFVQGGVEITMSGAAISAAKWPAPLGGVVYINGNNSSQYFEHADWLGSPRLVSSLSGHTAYLDQAYTPYGEIYSTFGTSQAYFDNFAGTTSNFYNGAVYDTPNRELSFIGRWLSPDPAGAGWNQYAYSTNPNSFVDPSGLYSCIVGSTGSQGCGSDNSYDESLNELPTGPGDIWDRMTWLDLNGCNCITTGQDATYFLGNYSDPPSNGYTGTYEPPGWNGGQQAQNQQTPQSLRDQIPGDVRTSLASTIKDSDSPTPDDKTGGFHEEYAVAGTNASGGWVVSRDKPGPYANPDTANHVSPSYKAANQEVANSIVDPRVIAHVHPSGETATHNWKQPPSAEDIAGALPGQINIVFGARDHKVYFYNSAGKIGKPMKLKDFLP